MDELLVGRLCDVTTAIATDPAEMLSSRLRQKMALSRYGRISPWEWERRDVNELREHFAMLLELLKAESVVSRSQEER